MAIFRNTIGTVESATETQFYQDVIRGLSSSPRYLQSKYFYDAEGDRLFQQIMATPEYYLTRCEMEIFVQQTRDIAHTVLNKLNVFDVIELGAGDATKSIQLLECLVAFGLDLSYYPVDISCNVIEFLEKELPLKVPDLKVHGLNGEYIEMIKLANQLSRKKKLVLFLGSNIGNFSPEDAGRFLSLLQHNLSPGDLLLIGIDLKKDPRQILAAYNDHAGITRQFNLNLLTRINRELGADFSVSDFDHFPNYNPVTGACRSYLISLKKQEVRMRDHVFHFRQYEPVYMELSQKYALPKIEAMAEQAGFRPVRSFFDSRNWFVDALWQKV